MKRLGLGFTLAISACASAQWTVVNLNGNRPFSQAYGVNADQQVGEAHIGTPHAVLWSGSWQTMVDLHPAGYTASTALRAHNAQQVGNARNTNNHAIMWTGSAGSAVILHPAGQQYSSAADTNGSIQVGYSGTGPDGARACMWTGTAASWQSIHPVSATSSWASACDENQIVGTVDWHPWIFGDPGVDLTPTSVGWAHDVHSGQQVGWQDVGGEMHASLWSGSAESRVDLHPPGLNQYSEAFGVFAGRQVGYTGSGGGTDWAHIWYGTAASAINLHDFVSADFRVSWATGVWVADDRTYVSGYGFLFEGNQNALLWISRAVAPTSFSMFRGTVFSGNLASLINSDGNKLVLRPGVVLTSGEPPVQIRINSTAPTGSPNGISFSVESSASFAFAQQKVSLWNYDTGTYELLNTRTVTTSDDTLTVTVRTNAHRFIDNGTLAMRALVSYKSVGPSILYPWSARIDKVWWTFPG